MENIQQLQNSQILSLQPTLEATMYYEVKTTKSSYEGKPGQTLDSVIETVADHLSSCEMDAPTITSIVRINEDESEILLSPMAVGYFEDLLDAIMEDNEREARLEVRHNYSLKYSGQ